MVEQAATSPGGGLWSSFHSSLAQLVRSPPAPQRQQDLETAGQRRSAAQTVPDEFRAQFVELDLLIE